MRLEGPSRVRRLLYTQGNDWVDSGGSLCGYQPLTYARCISPIGVQMKHAEISVR
jgi:hypothetical protein